MAIKILSLLLALVFTTALARPHHKQSHHLRSLLRKLKNQEEGFDCTALSETAGEVLSHSGIMIQAATADSPVPSLKIDDIKELINRVFGFDIFEDNQAREDFTCRVTSATTLSQLKAVLEDTGYSFNEFRLVYDYFWGALQFAIDSGMGSSFGGPMGSEPLRLLHAVESAGLADLDPEGVQFLTDFMKRVSGFVPGMLPPSDYTPGAPYPGSAEAKCNRLTNVVQDVLQGMEQQHPMNHMIFQTYVEMFTGLDIGDNQLIRRFICSIVSAKDLFAVFQAIDDYGVFNHIYKLAYPYVSQYLPLAEEKVSMMHNMMEEQLNMIEMMYLYIGGGGGQNSIDYYGGDFPNQIPQHGYDYPNYHGGNNGGPGGYPGDYHVNHHGGQGGYPGGPGQYPGGPGQYPGGPGGYPGDYPGGPGGYPGGPGQYPGGPDGYPGDYPGGPGNYPGGPGQYPGGPGGYPGGPGEYPGGPGGPPGGTGGPSKEQLEQLVEALKSVLKFLRLLKSSGLASLPDDIPE